MQNISILIPTLNAGVNWDVLLKSIDDQNIPIAKKIIIDSGSTDDTIKKAINHGFEVLTIQKKDFDHGYARQILAEASEDCDLLVYMTQDCFLKGNNAISNLVKSFEDKKVGISFGRQIPHKGAKTLETHARLFNYPEISVVKKLDDKDRLGIKTASCSNSYSAYRKIALKDVGGFPSHTILGEDVIVGGKMLIKGWKIAYVANSEAYHSHDYTVIEEFKRYFDIGVYHATNHWLIDEFGKADGEGVRYLKSEVKYVIKNNILVLPKMLASIGAKFVGYKLGLMYDKLSLNQRKKFSMHRGFWDKVIIK
jgi:rhamnosyltransferase